MKHHFFIFSFLLLNIFSSTLMATDYSWDGVNNAVWTTPANWDLDAGYPNANNDRASISSSETDQNIQMLQDITLDKLNIDVSLGSLTIGESNVTLTFSGQGEDSGIEATSSDSDYSPTLACNINIPAGKEVHIPRVDSLLEFWSWQLDGAVTGGSGANLFIGASSLTFGGDVIFDGGSMIANAPGFASILTFNNLSEEAQNIDVPILEDGNANNFSISSNSFDKRTIFKKDVESFDFVINSGSFAEIQASLSNSISIGGTLIFNPNQDRTYTNQLISGGDITIAGSNTTTLIPPSGSTFSGQVTVNNPATLDVQGNLNSAGTTFIVDEGGLLMGNASIAQGSLTNNGTVQPGNSVGSVLTVTGDYTQSLGADLLVPLSSTATNQLAVTGTATLAAGSTITPQPASGLYAAGLEYPVLIGSSLTDGSILTGNYASFFTKSVSINGVTTLKLITIQPFVITPVSIQSLTGNASKIVNYTSNLSVSNASADLNVVISALMKLPSSNFLVKALSTSTLPFTSIPRSKQQTLWQMALTLDKQFQDNIKTQDQATVQAARSQAPLFARPQTGLFLEPLAIFIDQDSQGKTDNNWQVGYKSYTYGAGLGYNQVLDNRFVIEGGIGYTHSNLKWKENFGNADWSSLYVAPFFGWFDEHTFANAMLMAGFNFHNTDRRISFTGVERVAKSSYNSYDLVGRLNGGMRVEVSQSVWVQPEVTLNYAAMFTDAYKETGAGGINLDVKESVNNVMQPSFRFNLLQEFQNPVWYLAPKVYVGWLANIPLGDQSLSARYENAPSNLFFNIEGNAKTKNQLVLGADIILQQCNFFVGRVNFEADVLSRLQVYIVKLKFEWLF